MIGFRNRGNMAQVRKQPLRKCAGCGLMKEKQELVRIVKTETGTVRIDQTGRLNGRGVYLCRDAGCLQKARKSRALERSLKCAVPPDVYDEIGRQLDGG